jgi:hypothetical protein
MPEGFPATPSSSPQSRPGYEGFKSQQYGILRTAITYRIFAFVPRNPAKRQICVSRSSQIMA